MAFGWVVLLESCWAAGSQMAAGVAGWLKLHCGACPTRQTSCKVVAQGQHLLQLSEFTNQVVIPAVDV